MPTSVATATDAVEGLRHLPGLVWLDSNTRKGNDSRYSFVGVEPVETIEVPYGEPPLAALKQLESPPMSVNYTVEGPPASAIPAWIGYIGYDATWSARTCHTPPYGSSSTPIVYFARYDALFVFDHIDGNYWAVGDDEESCLRLLSKLQTRGKQSENVAYADLEADDPNEHAGAIHKALDYIRRGDIYQVNLSRRWSARFDGEALSLWKAMRRASEVPLGMYLDAYDHSVLACTMERFLRWDRESGRLETRPIKGTLARSSTDDAHKSESLRADPKEQAEHVMIVDLMRNDLGRVAKIGSVKVEAPLVVEPFTGLYHLVSTVACTTRDEVTFADVVDATFPPGSVTGAPKIRAVEIIEELESHPREVYCGCVGFVDRQGGCSLAVSIRTALVREGHAFYWAGGGLVAASDVQKEVAETELKARVFLDALHALQFGTNEKPC